jgi:hypothetical protein
MFLALPTELFLVIRNYLVEFDVENDVDDVHGFIREESERSWRCFLAVGRTYSLIRKERMVWSLNKMAFQKYSKNEQFRQYLNERMVNPTY